MFCFLTNDSSRERTRLREHSNDSGAEWIHQCRKDTSEVTVRIFWHALDDECCDFRDGFGSMGKVSMVICVASVAMAAHDVDAHELAQVLAHARRAKTRFVKLRLLHFVDKVAEVAAILGLVDMGEELKPQRV